MRGSSARRGFFTPQGFAVAGALMLLTSVGLLAQTVVVNVRTDTTWKMSSTTPSAGWNTQVGFNDAAWPNAIVNSPNNPIGSNTADHIWDNASPFAGSTNVWFRKVFTTSGAAVSAIMDAAADDDVQIWLNGTLVVNNADCVASQILGTNVLSNVVVGQNLIAVAARDCGFSRTFGLYMDVTTQSTAVPVMGPAAMWVLAFILAMGGMWMIRRRHALATPRH